MAPIAKNEIQLRFENLADLYDRETTGSFFDLMAICTTLGKQANVKNGEKFHFDITEMSLTG